MAILWKGLSVAVLALFWTSHPEASEARTSNGEELGGLPPDLASSSYRIGLGDELKVDVRNEPDLSGVFQVSEDGTITFYLLGEVPVQGLSPDQVRDTIQESLARDYLVNPQVMVQVQIYSSQPVQVLGAVKKPGRFILEGPTDILEILALAGGINSERSIKEVQVRRLGAEEAIQLNIDNLIATGQGNLFLQAGDVVYVPEGQVVYVAGQVKKPGPIGFREGLTVTQALTEAGGPTATARLRKVYLLRDGARLVVNMKRIIQGKDADLKLVVGDQVFLEESVF